MTTFTKEQLIEHITRQLDQYHRLIKAQPLGDNTYNRKTISAMEIALASLTADPVLPKQPVPMAFDEAWENTGHLFIDNKQYAALFYGLGYKAALAQPATPEQPPTELKIGTSKHVNPYYIAQCTTCGWLGSSEDCLGDEDDCDCPLCYANAEEVDAETAFNVMLDALNKLRASTAQQNEPQNIPKSIPAQPVSEPYKFLDERAKYRVIIEGFSNSRSVDFEACSQEEAEEIGRDIFHEECNYGVERLESIPAQESE